MSEKLGLCNKFLFTRLLHLLIEDEASFHNGINHTNHSYCTNYCQLPARSYVELPPGILSPCRKPWKLTICEVPEAQGGKVTHPMTTTLQ